MNGEQVRLLGTAALARLAHARDASGLRIDRYGWFVVLRQRPVLLLAMCTAAAVLLAACSSGAGRTPSTALDASVSAAPVGFETAEVRVRRADGSVCVLCTYVARTPEEQRRGLMGVTNLDGFDGMTFVFDPPTASNFWMRNTVLALTGVWFDAEGGYLGAYDMQPCPDDQTACPLYGPGRPAATVVEFLLGDDQRFGIGEGAVLESVGGPCDPGAAPPSGG